MHAPWPPPAPTLLASLVLLRAPTLCSGTAGASGSRTRARDAWRWQLFQTPDTAPEFQFSPSPHRDSAAPSELWHEPPSWWRDRDLAFEAEGMFCAGRWLGVQVLQAPEDLLYLQQVLARLRPRVVLEVGTYRGGLAFFAASVLSQLGLADARVVTMDTFDMESNFYNLDNQPLCPVCHDCAKSYETDLWRKHVVFFQGNSLRLVDQVHRFVAELRGGGNLGPVVVTLDAQHSYDATLTELHLYAGLVDVGSYLVIQDARLDAIYGRAGPLAAGARLLEDCPSQWVWDRDVETFGHTQHLWLRRVARGPPVGLSYFIRTQPLIGWSPFKLLQDGARCGGHAPALQDISWPVSLLACQALCMRVADGACRFLSFSPGPPRCILRRDCEHLEPAATSSAYEWRQTSQPGSSSDL